MQTIAKSEQEKAPDYAQIWFTPKRGAMLAFKHALRYAVEQGVDVVSWDTGETQAARYDLSKQVDRITYFKNKTGSPYGADGTYNIHVYAKGQDEARAIERPGLSVAQVEELIGKDAAKKVVENAGTDSDAQWYSRFAYHFAGNLSGLNLKVGGNALKTFYDSILPNLINRYVKKWGAKVGDTTLETPGGSGNLVDTSQKNAVHSLDITPAMR